MVAANEMVLALRWGERLLWRVGKLLLLAIFANCGDRTQKHL
jgi:hypothetical protein